MPSIYVIPQAPVLPAIVVHVKGSIRKGTACVSKKTPTDAFYEFQLDIRTQLTAWGGKRGVLFRMSWELSSRRFSVATITPTLISKFLY